MNIYWRKRKESESPLGNFLLSDYHAHSVDDYSVDWYSNLKKKRAKQDD